MDVPLMYQAHNVRYVEDSTIQAVELPYDGDRFSMVILLPRDIDGCAKVEGLLNSRNLSSWLNAMRFRNVMLC
jgi:serpin B